MLLAAIYALIRLLLDLLLVRTRSEADRDLELLALRHEVAILRRHVRRPELLPPDRLVLAALGRRLPAGRLLFTPATLLRWHRELVRRRWAAFGRRPRRGRPSISEEVRGLVVRIATENPRWGERRIQGELLKLGYRLSNSTIRKLLRRHRLGPAPRRSGPTWSQFLRAHGRAVLACDFLAIDSVRLGVFYVLVFLELGSRRVLFCNATAHPDSTWVAQQARNAAWELEELEIPITVLIHDRDSKYGSDFDAVFSAAGIRIVRTPFRAPRANAACERVLGTLRRECLDWLIILGERHLVQVLHEYVDHYNRARPHRGLGLRPPDPQPIPEGGLIVRRQRLHGLINEYSRAA
jgi:transposase InsO family protein